MRTPTSAPFRRGAQRGVGALVVTLLLLFAASVGVLYVNRAVLFEQRASANQAQATLAQEVAEAGLEWVVGMINNTGEVDDNCAPTSSGMSFRQRYLQTSAGTGNYDMLPRPGPANNMVFPGCKVNPSTGAMTCSCPNPAAAGVASIASDQPSFTVGFERVYKDPADTSKGYDTDAVRVTVYACNANSATCNYSNYRTLDGSVRASSVLKLMYMIGGVPAAPLTCGTSCDLGGSYNIINQDVATNGALVDAGTTIDTGPGTTLTSIPGLPGENALIADDKSLYNLAKDDANCDNSAIFKEYFRQSIEEYRDAPTTTRISCGSAADCKTKLNAAIDQDKRFLFFDTDLQLSGSDTYGSSSKPIIIVTEHALKINGNNTFYGLLFANNSEWNDIGTGASKIYGAQVSCAAFKSNGNGTLSYDPSALKNAQRGSAAIVRVPGSWRDFFDPNMDTVLP